MEDYDGNLKSDDNGSAKIAFIAIKSFLGAWHVLYEMPGNKRK